MPKPPRTQFQFRQPPAIVAKHIFQELHEKGISLSADMPAYWVVGNSRLARQVLLGDDFTSQILGDGGVTLHCPISGKTLRPEQTLLASDGSHHARLKSVLVEALRKSGHALTVAQLHAHARERVLQMLPRGECDFLADFAIPVSNWATCQRLGLQHEEFAQFEEEVNGLMSVLLRDLHDRPQYERLMSRMTDRLARHLHLKAESGHRGVIAQLAQAHHAGRISFVEALNLTISVIQGMSRTAAFLAADALVEVLRPGRREHPGSKASLARRCVAGALKRSPPVHALLRIAGNDTRVGAYEVAAGTPIVIALHALALETEAKTCAFGLGRHACPSGRFGQMMAEQLVSAALEYLPGLVPDLRCQEAAHQQHPVFSGRIHLPLSWDITQLGKAVDIPRPSRE